MSEPKVNLIITLPGSAMISPEEAKASEKQKTGTGFSTTVVNYVTKGRRHTIYLKIRRTRPVKQVTVLSEEAFRYMTGRRTPGFVKQGIWAELNQRQRLEAHLKRYCHDLGGISYTYSVLGYWAPEEK